MSTTSIPKAVQKELHHLFKNYSGLELMAFLRKLYNSYLHECAESGLPENFAHENCMADQLFYIFELVVKEDLKKRGTG